MSGEELAPTFANTGELTHHALGCRCWPHVSEQDALDAIAAVGLAEYRDGRTALAAPSTPEPSGPWPCCTDATGMPVPCQHRALLAAPSTPEPLPPRWDETAPNDERIADALAATATIRSGGRPNGWPAPSTEPALDVERLALAEHRRAAHRDGSGCTHQWFRASDRSGAIGSVNIEDAAWLAAEYDRLAESQP